MIKIQSGQPTFDGTPAPLLYGAPSQINAIVPFGLSTTTTTQVEVFSQGQAIARLPLSVVTAVPAIFTLDSSGVGPGAILNQDSSVNSPSNPAEKGSVVSVFATGAGQTDPPSVDGQVAGAILPPPFVACIGSDQRVGCPNYIRGCSARTYRRGNAGELLDPSGCTVWTCSTDHVQRRTNEEPGRSHARYQMTYRCGLSCRHAGRGLAVRIFVDLRG
jgi:hypothetical protein